LPRGKLGVESF